MSNQSLHLILAARVPAHHWNTPADSASAAAWHAKLKTTRLEHGIKVSESKACNAIALRLRSAAERSKLGHERHVTYHLRQAAIIALSYSVVTGCDLLPSAFVLD